MLINALIEQLN